MDFLLSIMQVSGQKTQREAFCHENFKFYSATDKVVFEERIIYYLYIAFVSMNHYCLVAFFGMNFKDLCRTRKKTAYLHV